MARKRNRKRKRKRNNLDMISTLPDHIICHILSFIPTKFSVRTSVLSTRWKNLFTHVPVLYFNSTSSNKFDTHRFIHFVDEVMRRYNVVSMQKFALSGYEGVDHADRWITDAIGRNVRELCIGDNYSRIQLPVDIYTSKTLVRLEVDGNFISNVSDDSICLPSLKTLKLFRLETTVVRICSSKFPVLEDLCIHSDMVNIDICVSSLKRLTLTKLTYSGINFVLNASALEFMDITFHDLIKMRGSRLESLVEAHLTAYTHVDLKYADEIQNLIRMVSNVHNLSLCDRLIEVFARRDLKLPVFHNLARLELRNTRPMERNLLLGLLKSSPNLEILIFTIGLLFDHDNTVEMVDLKALHECVCISQHLKEVKMSCFYGVKLEFQIVDYFLKNAKVLNKMVITLGKHLKSQDKITQRLLALPKYSRDCTVVVL